MKINFLNIFKRSTIAFATVLLLSTQAQAALVPGDIAVVGFNAETSDASYGSFKFAFVLLKEITAGEATISFTDKGWIADAFSANVLADGVLKWTPTSTYAAGTIITVTINGSNGGFTSSNANFTAQSTVSSGWTNATVSSGGGDQILIYQGTEASPTFIYGFTNTSSVSVHATAGTWAASGVANSASNSELPTGLVNGSTAVAHTKDPGVGSTNAARNATDGWHTDNLYFKGPYSGTRAALLAAIGNPANWFGDDVNVALVDITPGGTNFQGTNPIITVLTPAITVTGTLTAFASCAGLPSAAQSISVAGSALTNNISIGAPTGFEISLSSGSGYATTLTLIQSGGTIGSTNIFVRLSSTATGTPSGNLTFTSTGTPSQNKAVSGTVTTITANTSQVNVACNGAANGSATVVANGGTPNYTYIWSPSGGTAATAQGLTAGGYSVKITDANQCSITKTFSINEPTALVASTSQNNVSCNGGSNGSASVVTSGGTPGYIYQWSPSGGTAAIAQALKAGSYSVLITDANDCSITKTFNITQPSAIDVTVSVNGNVLTANATSGTYQWINCPSNTTIPNAVNKSYTASNGSFAVIVTQATCKDTSKCIDIITTSLNMENTAGSSTIYPNPSNGNFLLNLGPEVKTIKIVDLTGREIFSKTTTGNEQMTIQLNEHPGIYHVVLSGERNKTYKLLIE